MDTPEWLNTLTDEELKSSKTLQKFPDVDRLAKSYIEAEKRISNSVSLPKDDSDEEAYERVLAKLGKPVSADEYDNPPDMDEYNKKLLTEVAHKSGLTKRQYSAFAKMLLDKQKSVVEQGINKTKAELGEEFDRVNSLLDKVAPDIKSALYQSGLVANSAFMKSFTNIIKQFDEDKLIDGQTHPKQNSEPYSWMKDYFRR